MNLNFYFKIIGLYNSQTTNIVTIELFLINNMKPIKKICETCKKAIDGNQLKNCFVFMIGDLIEGKFYAKKTIYYHLKCLNGYESYKKKRIILNYNE